MTIPVIETDRLRLRAFNHDTDFDTYAAFYASDVTRYYGGPLTRELAWRAASTMMGHWIIRGYGPWAVEEKSTGDFCGMVGLWNPEAWPAPEITWAIIESKQKRGIAAEAAIRARTYAYETLQWDSVYSCIAENNAPSIALAKKLGATLDRAHENSTRGTMLIYRHCKPA